jgi:hypothetical protein
MATAPGSAAVRSDTRTAAVVMLLHPDWDAERVAAKVAELRAEMEQIRAELAS